MSDIRDLINIFDCGIDENNELTWAKIEKKVCERKKVIHRNLEKKKRNVKNKRDYIDKHEMYENMVLFINSDYKDTSARKFLVESYYLVAKKLINSKNFYMYSQDNKNDMISESVIKGLSIGKEGRSNYGIPYFARFDPNRTDNVFSFFSQMIGNFFIQYLNGHYEYENIKQSNLERMINDFECKNNYSNTAKGSKFGIGGCVDAKE